MVNVGGADDNNISSLFRTNQNISINDSSDAYQCRRKSRNDVLASCQSAAASSSDCCVRMNLNITECLLEEERKHSSFQRICSSESNFSKALRSVHFPPKSKAGLRDP
jgi:hypothetical protein